MVACLLTLIVDLAKFCAGVEWGEDANEIIPARLAHKDKRQLWRDFRGISLAAAASCFLKLQWENLFIVYQPLRPSPKPTYIASLSTKNMSISQALGMAVDLSVNLLLSLVYLSIKYI